MSLFHVTSSTTAFSFSRITIPIKHIFSLVE
jgi:hypothetical protein